MLGEYLEQYGTEEAHLLSYGIQVAPGTLLWKKTASKGLGLRVAMPIVNTNNLLIENMKGV